MFRLPAGADYSLLAMLHLADRYATGELVKAADVAAAQDIPLPFLERLLAQLRSAGLLESMRGPGGGHRLSRLPESITAYQVVEAILGPGSNSGRLGFLWKRCEGALGEVLSLPLSELANEWRREARVADYQI